MTPRDRLLLTIIPFLSNVSTLNPLKTPQNERFLVFSGSIKWEHWPEMG